ncbi:MAG: insulinase family protein [Gemmatimonadales bacterium]|nr:MAG: insulinase family protein [Gemmatimonadales bacterium]
MIFPTSRRIGRRVPGGHHPPGLASVRSDAASSEETRSDPVRGRMERTVLENGLEVVTEAIPGVRSVSLGVWVRHGGAHEAEEVMGASHLLEHMVFKGTRSRSPREIVMALERLGGGLDAFTSREHTSYQARVLPDHLPIALDVIGDMVLEPLLRAADLELERQVVLEEISTVEDTPDDLVFELHGELLWDGHPYGRSILGSRASVEAMDIETLRGLHRERYRCGSLVVAAAGYLDHDAIVRTVEERFGGLPRASPPTLDPLPAPRPARTRHVVRDTTQTHIVLGTRTPPRASSARFPLILLSAALGGGMGSRLFQKVREELALAYTVFSFQSFHAEAGVSGVYVGTRPEWADRAVDAILGEMEVLASKGLGAEELHDVKNQVKGQVMLSLESTSARLYRLAGFSLHGQPWRGLDDLLARIDAVRPEEVREAASRYLDPAAQDILRLGPGTGNGALQG